MPKTTICLLSLLLFLTACSLASESLPTLVPTVVLPTQASAPTNTVAPTPTWNKHANIETLVERVAGSYIRAGSLDIFEDMYPDGRLSYDVDLAVKSPEDISRQEMLILAYTLQHEFYYNFAEDNAESLILHLRASPGNIHCVFGLGIGYQSVPAFLPMSQPPDLEGWFQQLVSERYYADLSGQIESLLAYGNDPSDKPGCSISEWWR
ncbi:hypothetical protein MNBD_CHLOROFLEXI01-1589 [hydrothermal vent metagenome]|uniref:Uncharacterized protein n=1 Tax=hydrothermal vent metagenome TaxID=652676 RepID=A0A3B0V987_9ZZZZ